MREDTALWEFYQLPNDHEIPGEMDQHGASTMMLDVRSIAREASGVVV